MAEVYNNDMIEHLMNIQKDLSEQIRAVVVIQDYSGSFSSEGKASELVKAKTTPNHPTPCDICDNYLGNANPVYEVSFFSRDEGHSHQ